MLTRQFLTVLVAGSLLAACSDDLAVTDGGPMADATMDDATQLPDSHINDGAATDEGAAPDGAVRDADVADSGMPFAYRAGTVLGHVGDGLDEVSGIVASRTYPGIFWVHNDSGDTPRFFAIDSTAATVATINVSGATSQDWEDIAITAGESGDVIYLANTGDNSARDTDGASGRDFVELYRVEEPDPHAGDATTSSERFEIQYPDRPHDCESVFVDHPTGDVYFITKENAAPAVVFVARAPLTTATHNVLENVGTFNLALATAADESRDGSRIAVRGYVSIGVYVRGDGESVIDTLSTVSFLSAPFSSTAEAVCFEPTGYGLYTIAEGVGASLFSIPWAP